MRLPLQERVRGGGSLGCARFHAQRLGAQQAALIQAPLYLIYEIPDRFMKPPTNIQAGGAQQAI